MSFASATKASRDRWYRLCTLSIRSEIDLPELTPIEPDEDPGAGDLVIGLGVVPDSLEGADHAMPGYETRNGDTLLLIVPGVARYLLQAPGRVTIQPILPTDAPDIRNFLFGTVFGACVHMRGLLPLHASAVRVGEGAVAFSGVSAAGKSTLAAFLAERGLPVVADDVCVVDGSRGPPLLLPSFPRLKLWHDAMRKLGKPERDEDRDGLDAAKYHVVYPGTAAPLPLSRLYILADARGLRPTGIEPVSGVEAMELVMNSVYRPRVARHLRRSAAVFGHVARLMEQVPVAVLWRDMAFDRLDAVCDRLRADW